MLPTAFQEGEKLSKAAARNEAMKITSENKTLPSEEPIVTETRQPSLAVNTFSSDSANTT